MHRLRPPFPVVLTIAGSDCTGGAGIAADLRTFLDHAVHGAIAITAVTAQGADGVARVDVVPVEGLVAQIEAVFRNSPVAAVKIGMLAKATHVVAVSRLLEGLGPQRPPVVVDPVLSASAGGALVDPEGIGLIGTRLLAVATLATPNRAEAARMAGLHPSDAEGIEAWAASAPCPVLLTGGDVEGDTVTDRLFSAGAEPRTFTGPRVPGPSPRGTGCTLSSAIAARRARGVPLPEAVEGSIGYVRALIEASARAS